MSKELNPCPCCGGDVPRDAGCSYCRSCWESVVEPASAYVQSLNLDDEKNTAWYGYAICDAFVAGAAMMMRRHAEIEQADAEIYRCNGCDFEAPRDEMGDAKNLFERLEVGDAYTDKQCPHCDALVFPIDQE